MILDEFEKLLKQTMGLDAASIGISAIERAVQTRTVVQAWLWISRSQVDQPESITLPQCR